MEGNLNTCSREEAKKERETENHLGGAMPPNLMKISLFGLASLPFLLVSWESCPCSMRVHVTNKGCSQQTCKRDNKETKRAKWGQTSMFSNKRWCPKRTNVGLYRVSVVPLD